MAADGKAAARVWLQVQSGAGRGGRALVVVLGMLGTAAAVGQAWCVARLLAAALGGEATAAAPWAAWFAGLAVLRAGLAYAAERLGFEAGAAGRRRLRTGVLVGLFAAGPAAAARRSPGVLGALAVDRIEALGGYFGRWLPAAALAVAGPAIVAAALLMVDPVAAGLLGVTGLLVPLGMGVAGLGAAAASRQQFVAMGRLQARFLDRMRGIATLVLAGQAEAEAERLRVAADELTRRTMRVLRVAFLSSAALDCAAAAAFVLLALRYAAAWRAGAAADPAAAVFSLVLVAEFFAPLRSFAAAYQDRLQAGEAAELLAEGPVLQPQPGPAPAVRTVVASGITVTFEQVGFTWNPARGPVLDGLSFRVPAGETVILLGPSGAGKSTVIELLLGFVPPAQGRITLNGADLASITPEALSRMTAWIGQRPVLFAGSIRENIRFGREDATEAEIEAAATFAGIGQFAAALPQGLDTPIGEDGFGLSGGQAQRIAIARAFVRDAPLLLLDEPTAHLDPATEADVLDSLRRLALGRTVLLASHSSAAAAFAGRRIVLAEAQAARAQGAA